jgi:hypothetical protein
VSGFFHQTSSPGPYRHAQDRFRFFSNIRGVIRIRNRLPSDEYTGESRLPGSEYTEESITNSNNSSNIRKNSKSFLGVSNGTRRRCLIKKTSFKKSRDTVPLKRLLDLKLYSTSFIDIVLQI